MDGCRLNKKPPLSPQQPPAQAVGDNPESSGTKLYAPKPATSWLAVWSRASASSFKLNPQGSATMPTNRVKLHVALVRSATHHEKQEQEHNTQQHDERSNTFLPPAILWRPATRRAAAQRPALLLAIEIECPAATPANELICIRQTQSNFGVTHQLSVFIALHWLEEVSGTMPWRSQPGCLELP